MLFENVFIFYHIYLTFITWGYGTHIDNKIITIEKQISMESYNYFLVWEGQLNTLPS